MKILKRSNSHDAESLWQPLVRQSLAGNREAVDHLLISLQPLVYDLAQKMLLNPDDAADASQEIMLKVVLNLGSYDSSRAAFTTWVYTIARNQILNFRKGKIEALTTSFDAFAEDIQNVSDEVIDARQLQDPETQLMVKEANVGCMLGMLLCLTREQRMVYILGEILRLKSDIAASICGVSAENFRQQLARARRDLYSFMQDKCGLVNKANPCRCHRKAMGFVRAGYVDPHNIRFAAHHYENARIFSEQQADALCNFDAEYGQMFRNLPSYDHDSALVSVRQLTEAGQFRGIFRMEE